MDFYAVDFKDAFSELKSSRNGLSDEEAAKRLAEYGFNELEKEKRRNALNILSQQFMNYLIILLIVASALSVFLGEYLEAAGMASIVLLSAALGFIQEYRAEKAMEALEKISAPTGRVIRGGVEKKVSARDIVPGDVLLLEAGDIVAADSRLFEESNLRIDEATLTGESVPSKKLTCKFPIKTPITDQENMAFMGTVVTYGKGRALVTSTGMSTEFGKIAESLQKTEETKTPLQVKFDEMAKKIGLVVVILVTIVFFTGLLVQKGTSIAMMLIFSISLAVAAVPSALPAIVTIGLALGAASMAKKNMIIKKLPATESLGSVTVICTDKTGTLTKNEMTATKLFFSGMTIDVTGTGYQPEGDFKSEKKIDRAGMEMALKIGVLCSNAKLFIDKGKWGILGDPTEGALLTLARKAGIEENEVSKSRFKIQEMPFDSERKLMSVVFHNNQTGKNEAFTKGAPEILLKKCNRIYEKGKIRLLSKKDASRIIAANELFAKKALRVIALAHRELPQSSTYDMKSVEKNLVFFGLAGMMDPPRPEVNSAVKQCEDAGIKVMVITGDHPTTTKAVAEQIGLFDKDDLFLTGDELERMSDAELEKVISEVKIIARALPIQKSRIVDALKKKGHIVAMTGDGVNDAPALKKADIGVAMGITGTDVAKEVSKAVLIDDNFATIVNAVSEGRNIYDKIIKSARYLLSCNFGEIVAVFLAIIVKLPLPMVPMQILLMNLLTDGLPALGLGCEPAENDIMKRAPRNPKEKLFSGQMIAMTVTFGAIMGIGTLLMFSLYLPEGLSIARTVAFTTLVMFEMFAVVGSRSLKPFGKLNLFTNKWLLLGIIASVSIQIAVIYWSPLQMMFRTSPIGIEDWARIIAVSSLGFFIMEFGKLFIGRIGSRKAEAAG